MRTYIHVYICIHTQTHTHTHTHTHVCHLSWAARARRVGNTVFLAICTTYISPPLYIYYDYHPIYITTLSATHRPHQREHTAALHHIIYHIHIPTIHWYPHHHPTYITTLSITYIPHQKSKFEHLITLYTTYISLPSIYCPNTTLYISPPYQ